MLQERTPKSKLDFPLRKFLANDVLSKDLRLDGKKNRLITQTLVL